MTAVARNTPLAQQSEEVLRLDPNEQVGELERLGLEWAERDETAGILEETRKTLLAQLIRDEQLATKATGGKGMPMNQAENTALADARYETHIKAMVQARSEANRAKVRYDSSRVKIDLIRTLIATRREEMRLGGHRT